MLFKSQNSYSSFNLQIMSALRQSLLNFEVLLFSFVPISGTVFVPYGTVRIF